MGLWSNLNRAWAVSHCGQGTRLKSETTQFDPETAHQIFSLTVCAFGATVALVAQDEANGGIYSPGHPFRTTGTGGSATIWW